MDNFIFLAKIITRPTVQFIFMDPLISIINMKVQIKLSNYKNIIVNVIFWGNLEDFDIFDHYNINDYVIIEGYFSYSDTFEKTFILIAYSVDLFLPGFGDYF